jgi:hypothetical protein
MIYDNIYKLIEGIPVQTTQLKSTRGIVLCLLTPTFQKPLKEAINLKRASPTLPKRARTANHHKRHQVKLELA